MGCCLGQEVQREPLGSESHVRAKQGGFPARGCFGSAWTPDRTRQYFRELQLRPSPGGRDSTVDSGTLRSFGTYSDPELNRVQLCRKLEMVAGRSETRLLSPVRLFYRKNSLSGIEVALFFSQL